MQIKPGDLARHVARGLEPLYVVYGDEPLVVLECGDEIRGAARRAGFTEREILIVELAFKWDSFVAANANLALFGDRKLVDLRIPSGKPGNDGARLLEDYATNPNRDNVTLITLPRLDRATLGSTWFTALSDVAVTIAVQPIERDALPQWIGARLARQNQRASDEVLVYLAERCEGNLLAARQEIDKLALVLPQGDLSLEAVEGATTDVARYDVFAASEAWLAGDASRALRVLEALEAEGEAITLAVWQMGEDLRALATAQGEVSRGTPIGVAVRNARVWGRRQNAFEKALRRVTTLDVGGMLAVLARIDGQAKGLIEGDAWQALASLALAIAGKPVQPPASIAAGARKVA